MSNYQSMTQNPNGYNYTPEDVSPRQFHAAQLAADGVLWPRRLKARPTDQESAALTPYQLQLLIEGTGDPFRKGPVNTHPSPFLAPSPKGLPDCQVSCSELISLYIMPCGCERTTDTFGQEIVDELFSIHLGCISLDDDPHPTDHQMQELYEAFVDTFGETDAHLLFADAFASPSEEIFA